MTSTDAARVTIEPAKHQDIQRCAEIAMYSLASSNGDFFTLGPQPDQLEFRVRLLRSRYSDAIDAYEAGKPYDTAGFLVARLRESPTECVGFVCWTVSDGKQTKSSAGPPHDSLPRGSNTELVDRFFALSAGLEHKYMGDRKRISVKNIAVDATTQRTGAGALLLRGIRERHPSLPIYLEAASTPSAKPFYLKQGFRAVGTLDYNGEQTALTCFCLEPDAESPLNRR